ncbi:MFS transporter [Luteimicrobium subarcticum]|uniref:EmrB/QacA subfamily drug resistance transporter n=1 Tax=Luteimicrobium subarcticum TaxID=620910 RepID=A0A2M8W6R6_9MICO|nr:MFS transporter [Luteimicrobium subarcticum]PJI86616.1 EmrB/QacA subfamily drug resistance transporter [Luteimicrobium subarcticum]
MTAETSAVGRDAAKQPSAKSVMLVIALAVLVTSSAASSLNLALPSVAESTGATQTQMLWIVDAYTVPMAGLLLAAGALGDRYGRKRVLLTGLSLFGVAALVACFVDDPGVLIACRALMGIAGALVLPTTLSIITTTLPPERRGTAVGTWSGLAGAGAVLGMFASAFLLQFFAWNSVFVLTVALVVVAVVGAVRVLPDSRSEDESRLDLLGALLSLLTIAALVVALLEGPDRGWTDGLVLLLFAVGVLAGALMVWHELRTPHPMLDPRWFTIRGVETGAVTNLVLSMAVYGFMFLTTQYLQFVGEFTPLEVVCTMVPFALVMIPLSRVTPRLSVRYGAKATMTTGFLVAAAAFAACQLLTVDVQVVLVLAGLIGLGVGMAAVSPPATAAIVQSLPAEHQGVASAIGQTARSVAGALGVALIGALLNSGYASSLGDQLPPQAPPDAAHAVEASIAAANAIADQVGPKGQALSDAAAHAFVDGYGDALLGALVIALVGAAYALWRAPGRAATVD